MFARSHKQARKTNRRKTFQPRIESLEDRNLMAATGITPNLNLSTRELTITGTELNDNIRVKQSNGNILVYDDGTLKGTFDASGSLGVDKIVVNAKGGHDRVDLNIAGAVVQKPSVINGGVGNDTLRGGAAVDRIFGQGNADLLYGFGSGDFLSADAGNDTLYGGTGGDTLYGGADQDRLFGEDNADKLWGDGGNDYLHGGPGDDTMNGGSGTDTYRRSLSTGGGLSLSGDLGTADGEDEDSNQPVEVSGGFLTNVTQDSLWHVDQTGSPTCAFLAALAATAQWTGKFPELGSNEDLISSLSYDSTRDKYGVPMYVNNRWTTQWVNGDWTENSDPNGALWVTLYQKAFLQAMSVTYQRADGTFLPESQWKSTTGKNWQNSGVAMQALTGYTSTFVANASMSASAMQTAMTNGYMLTASSKDTGVSSTFVADHSYAVQSVFLQNGSWMVRLYNPWGHDRNGSSLDGKDDGSITVTWSAFKANFSGYYKN